LLHDPEKDLVVGIRFGISKKHHWGHLRVIKGKIDNTRTTRLIIGKDG
jgi:hypothetical protein